MFTTQWTNQRHFWDYQHEKMLSNFVLDCLNNITLATKRLTSKAGHRLAIIRASTDITIPPAIGELSCCCGTNWWRIQERRLSRQHADWRLRIRSWLIPTSLWWGGCVTKRFHHHLLFALKASVSFSIIRFRTFTCCFVPHICLLLLMVSKTCSLSSCAL